MRTTRVFLLGMLLGMGCTVATLLIWRQFKLPPSFPLIAQGMEAGRHAAFVARASQGGVEVLFIGDSLLDWFRDTPAWARFSDPHTVDFGMMGDTTAGLSWRIDHDELTGIAPRVVVLNIGTNDLDIHTDDQILERIRSIVAAVRIKCPPSRIVLLGITPRIDGNGRLARIGRINAALAATPSVRFADPLVALLDKNGNLPPEFVGPDGLHLMPNAYQKWADQIAPIIQEARQ